VRSSWAEVSGDCLEHTDTVDDDMNVDERLEGEFGFGPFRFMAFERTLLRGEEPLQLGSRAKDILLVLMEHAGDIVGKRELMARVWPGVVVEEGALRVHIAALRKTLVDGSTGTQYVENVRGLGYRFTAPLTRIEVTTSVNPVAPFSQPGTDDVPIPLTRMIGRTGTLSMVASRLPERRFMTIVGPAGMGKTTVAVAAADSLRAAYPHGVRHIDLASLSDPALIGGLIASRLRIQVVCDDPIHSLATHLHDKSMLIVMDNCEHLVQAVAHLVERLLSVAPNLHVLATSREPLRANGEWVLRLEPLELPSESRMHSAHEALQFPAIQLFAERAQASLDTFELHDADVPIVTQLCRRLDGLPLAIELAAAHVDEHGVRGLLTRIGMEHDLEARAQNAIVPRHHTLDAALDWSYSLLSECERVILHRLSVFVGTFSLEGAQFVATGHPADRAQVFEAIAGLIEKSLVSAEVGRPEMCYRLLETTRVYALRKLNRSGGKGEVARRHAVYYCELLERLETGHTSSNHTTVSAQSAEHISNVRAALQWSFSPEGDRNVGIALAAAAAPAMLDLSLLTECRAWTERSIAALDVHTRGTHREMEVQAALALSLMYSQGNSEESLAALMRAVELAEAFAHPHYKLRLYGALSMFLVRIGDFHGALELAQRTANVARSVTDPLARLIADSQLGTSHHLVGNHASARTHCEAALSQPPMNWYGSSLGMVGYDHRIRTMVALTRVLWLQGYADQAAMLAEQTIEEAEKLGHPICIGFSLIYTACVLLWIGRCSFASRMIERALTHTDRHRLVAYHALGLGLKAKLTLEFGDANGAGDLLRACLETLYSDRRRFLPAVFTTDIAEALAMSGQWVEALAAVDEALGVGAENRHVFHTPELLRIRARVLSLQSASASAEVERCLLRAIEVARNQAAPAWELRAATDLAGRWRDTPRHEDARELLAGVYGRFTEGFETTDLVAARRLLSQLE
jgi:predicted ATPase/DNA-binding winged helix-turn-helix (wHTH) protein